MEKLKVIFVPFGIIVLIIGGFVIVAQFVIGRITPLTSDLAISQSEKNALSTKVATLSQVNQSHLDQSEAAYLALPDKNPAAIVISQAKNLAVNNNVVITSIAVASTTTEGDLAYAVIELKGEASEEEIFAFMTQLATLAPLVSIENTKITSVLGEKVEMQLALHTYWSPFPEKLPALNEAVSGLSDDEVNILTQLSGLTAPTFGQLTPSESTGGRANPFAVGQ